MPRNQSKAHRYFGFVLELVGLAGHTGVVINGGTCPVFPHRIARETTMIGTWQALVIDCENPDALASFYEQLLGLVRVENDDDWVGIGDAPDRPALAFQRVDPYVAPEWPGHVHPQQAHIDVKVKDLDLAETQVLALGATSMGAGSKTFRVYLDPQGHPFCLVSW